MPKKEQFGLFRISKSFLLDGQFNVESIPTDVVMYPAILVADKFVREDGVSIPNAVVVAGGIQGSESDEIGIVVANKDAVEYEYHRIETSKQERLGTVKELYLQTKALLQKKFETEKRISENLEKYRRFRRKG